MQHTRRVTKRDYARLLAVRARLREFAHWSAQQAAALGLTASQHQLLLAVRGHGESYGPTIGQAAEYLMIRHNTAVELVDRCERLGLLTRQRDRDDQRVVRLRLTEEGTRRLGALAGAHLEELARLRPMIEDLGRDVNGP